ncbi:hypothetical protein Tco_0699757 [Tanacetum coccineum]
MARRSETYTQPLRDESVKSNVEQPSQHDDGNPLMSMRQVQFGTKRGDVVHEKPVNENQPHKDDGQRLTSDTGNIQTFVLCKPTRLHRVVLKKKSFLNVLFTEETKTATNPKVNLGRWLTVRSGNSDCRHAMAKMEIEYEWKPPRCSECLVFGHVNEAMPQKEVKAVPRKCYRPK